MDVRLLFPTLYIAAPDLIEAQKKTGKDGVVLTISRVQLEDLKTDRGSERKPVIFFREMEARHAAGQGENKRLVLNKTNAKAIAALYGFETTDWEGKRIELYPTQCSAFGKMVDCVRVKDQVPSSNGRKPKQDAPPPDDDYAPPVED